MTDVRKPVELERTDAVDGQRRLLLTTGLRLSLAATVLQSATAHATLCVDPDELSSTDRSFRKYVEFTESSKTPGETCGNCASFKPGESDCGTCQAVAGSINAQGHCNGWSARGDKKQ